MTKSDEYLAKYVAPVLESIFTNCELSQGSVIVDQSGFECEAEVWVDIPISEKSNLQLLAVNQSGNVVVKARFDIDPLDTASLLVDGRTPQTENFLFTKWVISNQKFFRINPDTNTSYLDDFVLLSAHLRLVWDLDEIVSLIERNQLGNPDYVRSIRTNLNREKSKIEEECEHVVFCFRKQRWAEAD